MESEASHHGSDVNTSAIVVIGVVSVLLLIEAVIGVWAWFDAIELKAHEQWVVKPAHAELINLQTQQRLRLQSYGWADQAGGKAHVPIGLAQKLYLQRSQQQSKRGK